MIVAGFFVYLLLQTLCKCFDVLQHFQIFHCSPMSLSIANSVKSLTKASIKQLAIDAWQK